MPKRTLPIKNCPFGNASPDVALRAFSDVLKAKKEYEIVLAQETTKREDIAARLKVRLQQLDNFRGILSEHLEREHLLRKEVIAGVFERLDEALSADNTQVAMCALSSIEGIVKTSPLNEVLNALTLVFENKNGVLDI